MWSSNVQLAVSVLLTVTTICQGHVQLTYPPARTYAIDFLDNARTVPPCGMAKGLSHPYVSVIPMSLLWNHAAFWWRAHCDTIIRPRCSSSAAAYSDQTFPWTICRSVRLCVGLCVCSSVCPVHCGKTEDWIRIPFGIIGRTGPGMKRVVEFGDRFTGRGTFGGEFVNLVRAICNQWGLYGVRVRQCRDAAVFSNYFGQTCSNIGAELYTRSIQCTAYDIKP